MNNQFLIILAVFFSLNLQNVYCINSEWNNQSVECNKKHKEINDNNLECIRTQVSSDSILLKTYPFDSDSIIIYYPDSCCDDLRIGENYEDHYHYLKKMSKCEIARFAEQFIDYDYKVSRSEITISENIYEYNRPDIVLLFYKNAKKNYLKMYVLDNNIRFESTFDENTDIYFKEWCKDLGSRMKIYFKTYFDYMIEECKNCDTVFDGELVPANISL